MEPFSKNLFRSQIIKNRKKYRRKIVFKRIVKLLSFATSISIFFFVSMILFYVAIDDGNGFYVNEVVDNVINTDSPITDNFRDFSEWNETCDFNLIVINKNNEIPKDFKNNLIKFDSFLVDQSIERPLSDMIDNAKSDSVNLYLSSAYRSLKMQAEIVDDEVYKNISNGYSKEESEKLVSDYTEEPGKSEYHTGLSVDFNRNDENFVNTESYKWLVENSQNYGFILRYPENKEYFTGMHFDPYHFRFVGTKAAKAMHGKDICFEEYIDSIR